MKTKVRYFTVSFILNEELIISITGQNFCAQLRGNFNTSNLIDHSDKDENSFLQTAPMTLCVVRL